MVKAPHALIIGCGDLGERVGHKLLEAGWRVSAMRRNADKIPAPFTPITGDYTHTPDLESLAALQAQFMIFTPMPSSRDEQGYRQGFTQPLLAMEELGLLRSFQGGVLVSSTRVYAELGGGWVDEDSPLTTEDPCAQAIIDAEGCFLRACEAGTVVRASGIYGEWPGMLIRRLLEGLSSPEPDRISNRIHRDDLASVIEFVLQRQLSKIEKNRIYLASDHLPTAVGEIEVWLSSQLSLPEPIASVSARRGNRRCSSRRLMEAGFTFEYPDYQVGFSTLIDAHRP